MMRGKTVAGAYQILQLPPGLFDNSVLTPQDDTHPGKIPNLGLADNQRVCAAYRYGHDQLPNPFREKGPTLF